MQAAAGLDGEGASAADDDQALADNTGTPSTTLLAPNLAHNTTAMPEPQVVRPMPLPAPADQAPDIGIRRWRMASQSQVQVFGLAGWKACSEVP